jgi:cyclohexanecarboxyl-CoA dehydrogenase
MGALGLIAPELPERVGGLGLGHIVSGLIIEKIAAADFNVAYIQLLGSLCGAIIADHAEEAVARPLLGRVIAGRATVALALTEPQGGSDAAGIRLKITEDGASYRLDGEKTSISLADQADVAIVFGRTGRQEDGAAGVTAVLVDLSSPGITKSRFSDHGQRSIGRGSLIFDGTVIPKSNRLGQEGAAFRQVMQGFDFSRALIGLQCLAVAARSLEETWRYVQERKAFGQPLSAFQGVSHILAEHDTYVTACRLLCQKTLWLKDSSQPHTAEAAMVKWWAPKLAYEAIHQCLLVHGHAGYSCELPFEQRLRDVLGLQIGDGTTQIMKTVIARARAGRRNVPF